MACCYSIDQGQGSTDNVDERGEMLTRIKGVSYYMGCRAETKDSTF